MKFTLNNYAMKNAIIFIASLCLLSGLTLQAQSPDLRVIRDQMVERLPQIEKLWADGIIGENNQGMVAWGFPGATREPTAEEQRILEDENRDRKAVYEEFARRNNTTLEKIGEQRAIQYARRAESGLWLQDADGRWYRKP